MPADDLPSVLAVGEAPARPLAGPWAAFGPLRHRNFRLLWSGLVVSQTGSWMQFIALGYLIDQLTRAPVYLGLLGLSQAIPRMLFAFVGGVAADRFDRRRVLLITNILLMGSATLLALLAATGRIAVWHILLIGGFNSLAMSFDVPARQSLVPVLVDEGELMPAVSLNSMAHNGSGIFGPSLGGVVIALVGAAGCFVVNALSYIAVVVALLRMDLPPAAARRAASFREDVREGLDLILHHPYLRALLAVVAVLSFFGRPYVRLMPAYAREVLQVGPTGLGVLQAAPAVGTILAVVVVGLIAATPRRGRLMLTAAVATALLVAVFGLTRQFPVAVVVLVAVGLAQAVAQAAANTLVQTGVAPHQRGRMMGVWSMVVFGMFALGTLPFGALAGVIGVGQALTAGGLAAAVLVGLITFSAPKLRTL